MRTSFTLLLRVSDGCSDARMSKRISFSSPMNPATQKHPSPARSDYSRSSRSSSLSSVRAIPFKNKSRQRRAVCMSECRMRCRVARLMSDRIHTLKGRAATIVKTITSHVTSFFKEECIMIFHPVPPFSFQLNRTRQTLNSKNQSTPPQHPQAFPETPKYLHLS